jgi:hypothetical protein
MTEPMGRRGRIRLRRKRTASQRRTKSVIKGFRRVFRRDILACVEDGRMEKERSTGRERGRA